ncbi:MAG: hypothetical protein PHX27_01400 [Candidatus ainarchaeum sp.]|nr:hypothetical protein [Candidatus ainarchaeum sp.]
MVSTNKKQKEAIIKKPIKEKNIIESVLKNMNYDYSTSFSNPIEKKHNFWNADLLIIEPNVYISFYEGADHFNKNEIIISDEEKHNFSNKKLKIIFLKGSDLKDKPTLSAKIKKELELFKKNDDQMEKIIKEPITEKITPIFKEEAFEDDLTIGSNFVTQNYTSTPEKPTTKEYLEDSDMLAVVGGIIIIVTTLIFFIFITMLIYLTFFK